MKVERFYYYNKNWHLEYYDNENYYSSSFIGDFGVVLSRYLELINNYDLRYIKYFRTLKDSRKIKKFLNSLK